MQICIYLLQYSDSITLHRNYILNVQLRKKQWLGPLEIKTMDWEWHRQFKQNQINYTLEKLFQSSCRPARLVMLGNQGTLGNEETPEFSFFSPTCTEERPSEDTVKRKLCTSHKERSHEKPAPRALWSWMSYLQNCEKINFCGLSHQSCGILLGQF